MTAQDAEQKIADRKNADGFARILKYLGSAPVCQECGGELEPCRQIGVCCPACSGLHDHGPGLKDVGKS